MRWPDGDKEQTSPSSKKTVDVLQVKAHHGIWKNTQISHPA